MLRAEGGVYHAPLNPVTKPVEFGAEAFVGARGRNASRIDHRGPVASLRVVVPLEIGRIRR